MKLYNRYNKLIEDNNKEDVLSLLITLSATLRKIKSTQIQKWVDRNDKHVNLFKDTLQKIISILKDFK